jgi:hypothetical protein
MEASIAGETQGNGARRPGGDVGAPIASPAARKRSMVMAITLPNGAVAAAAAPEDAGVTVKLTDGTRFGVCACDFARRRVRDSDREHMRR